MKTLISILISLITLVQPIANDPKTERKEMLDQLFEMLEQHIPNPAWLESEAYRTFREKLYSEESLTMEEQDFLDLFNRERHNLPFSHFQLHRKSSNQKEGEKVDPVTWKAIDERTAYMKVITFVTNAVNDKDALALLKALGLPFKTKS
jgi:hypothetical protein